MLISLLPCFRDIVVSLFSKAIRHVDTKQRTVESRGLIAVVAETPLSFLLNENCLASRVLTCYGYLI